MTETSHRPVTGPLREQVVGATTIRYIDAGAGDPIVFLHGNPTSSFLLRRVIPWVVESGRCLAPDLVGMGASDPSPAYAYRFDDHADALELFLDAVGATDRVVLVVHDWGSGLGFDWARRHPDRVAGIVYLEALVQPRTWAAFGAMAPLFQALRSRAGEELALGQDVFVEQVIPGGVIRELAADEMDAYRAPYPTRESRIPTLVWGREVPVDGEPADVDARVRAYGGFLAGSPIPKLLIVGDPGLILTEGGEELAFARTWSNQEEITVRGIHFLPEDSPDEIGAAVRDFIERVRG